MAGISHTGAHYSLNLSYTYDRNGNILTVSDGTNSTSYEYDSANQLLRENNQAAGKTWVYTYDNAGNIQSKTEYAYTLAADLTGVSPTDVISYGYNDPTWGDLLTSWDGNSYTYDEMGNLTSDGSYTYTWEQGRQLTRISNSSGVYYAFSYDGEGRRMKRDTVYPYGLENSYTYIYDGDKLSRMTFNSVAVYFSYDADGRPLTMTVNGETYYYVTNLQGDVVAILDASGQMVVRYRYDAYGKLLEEYCTKPEPSYNPLRYRGYVYDRETGLYYLNSRYYNPETGRFISADSYVSTGQGILGHNMFAYCGNNPIIRADSSGKLWGLVAIGICLVVVLSGCADNAASDVGAAKPYTPVNDTQYNCYAYALGETEWKHVGGSKNAVQNFDVDSVSALVLQDAARDGRSVRPIESYDSPIASNEYRIALRTGESDYHFMVQHSDGSWSHKPSSSYSRLIEGNNPSVVSWDQPIINIRASLKWGFVAEAGQIENYYDSATRYFAVAIS